MAISINWQTGVIFVPQADLTPLGGSRYGFDVDAFRLELKELEDDEEGIVFPATHEHVTETVLSGVTYSRFVEVLDPYTVEFEDGQYTVIPSGANHNLGDVKVTNQVSLIIGNSAGLQTVAIGSGVTAQDKTDIAALSAAETAASLDAAHGAGAWTPADVGAALTAVGLTEEQVAKITRLLDFAEADERINRTAGTFRKLRKNTEDVLTAKQKTTVGNEDRLTEE